MFYRMIRMQGIWYAARIESVEDDAEAIEALASEGEIVLITDDLETFADEFNVKVSDIKIAG